MTRFGFALCTAIVLSFGPSGCKDSTTKTTPKDGGTSLPDSFVSTGCKTADDCDDGNKCHMHVCNAATKACEFNDIDCSSKNDACNTGVCDPTSGECGTMAGNEGATCTTTNSLPGKCSSGTCAPVPTCYDANTSFNTASCASGDQSRQTELSNDPSSFSGGAANVSSYACAPTEAGPELGFAVFTNPNASDEDVTISIFPTDMNGVPTTTDTIDLDLIILEDTCSQTAVCKNPALTGGGFQGVTTGTGKERVTFHASAGHTYYAVVDGKTMQDVSYFTMEVEACGRCQPTTTTRLSCNMTMPVSTSTSSGASVLSSYTCGTNTVAAAGKEVPFFFETPDDTARNVTASLTGVTGTGADVKLLALPSDAYGACDPTMCLGFKDDSSGDTSLSFTADPSTEGDGFGDQNFEFGKFWVLVDSAGTVDTTFGLEFSCAPTCKAASSLLCGNGAGSDVKNYMGSTTTSMNQATEYGPSGGPYCGGFAQGFFTGPETAIEFVPTIISPKSYNIELGSKSTTNNLSFIVVDTGSSTTCDPTATCADFTATTHTGSTGTLTTNVSSGLTAYGTLNAVAGHTYYIIVDGTDAAGADFAISITGTTTDAGCQ